MANFLKKLFPVVFLIGFSYSSPHMGHEHEHEEVPEVQWGHNVTIKKMTGVDLKWNSSDPEFIIMEMTTKTTGYVSIGFCPEWFGSMKGCDIVIGWVDDKTGEAKLVDYYAESNEAPIVDTSQDYQLISGQQENHSTTIRFRRKWNTNDKNDAVLGYNPVQIIYAWHPSDPTDGSSIPPHDKNTRSHTTKMVPMKTAKDSTDALTDSSGNANALAFSTLVQSIFVAYAVYNVIGNL